MIEAWISDLPPAPEASGLCAEEEAEVGAKRKERERREQALAEREKRVQEEKRRQEKGLAFGRGRLREEERELERAMRVNKGGLKGQLGSLGEKPEDDVNE